MLKEEFIDLLNFSEEDKKDDDDENLNLILKEDLAHNLDNSEVIGEREVLENDEFVIKTSKVDGVLSEMEIECKCGKKTSIKFDYSEEGVDSVHGTGGEDNVNQAEAEESEEDEPAVFVEGIPAKTLYEKPEENASENLNSSEELNDQE